MTTTYGTFKFTDGGRTRVTMTMTMTVDEWRAVARTLVDVVPLPNGLWYFNATIQKLTALAEKELLVAVDKEGEV